MGPWSNLGFRLNRDPAPVKLAIADGSQTYELEFADMSIDDCLWVETTPHGYAVGENGVTRMFRSARHEAGGPGAAADGDILAPMPGKVIAVDVAEGDAVTAGQLLLVLEAMKMEHALISSFDRLRTNG